MASPVTVTIHSSSGGGGTTLTNAAGIQWLDELNGVGYGSFRIPYGDSQAGQIDYDKICKFVYEGSARFAILVENISYGVVDEAGNRWIDVSGRGVLAMLEFAVVTQAWPHGLSSENTWVTRKSPDRRWFNFGSTDIYMDNQANLWDAPMGVRWDQADYRAAGYPLGWPDPDADLLWVTDPTAGTTIPEAWFRLNVYSGDDHAVRLYYSGDNEVEVFFDGESLDIIQLAYYSWRELRSFELPLYEGWHTIAVRVKNNINGTPANFVMTAFYLDEYGEEDWVEFSSELSYDWRVTVDEPAWGAGAVLYQLMDEAQERGVFQISDVSMDFDLDTQTGGGAWTVPVRRAWDIVNSNLLNVALDLCELGCNVWMTPDLVLHCQESRGGGSGVAASDSTNTETWTITGSKPTGTEGWSRDANGWATAPPSGTPYGRREIGIVLGNSDSLKQATEIVQAVYKTTAQPQENVENVSMVPASGSKPYVNFSVGDTITGIDKGGSATPMRILSIAVSQDDDGIVRVTPELDMNSGDDWAFEGDFAPSDISTNDSGSEV